jgi:glycosyltransferase involved in cell wall biosynthesis
MRASIMTGSYNTSSQAATDKVITALDATPLTLSSGGLARYVTELSLALAGEFPQDTYVLLSDQKFVLPAGAPSNLLAGPGAAPGGRWWLNGIRRAIAGCGAAIFHGTNFEVPYHGRTPAILTIHDLSPWREPAWHGGAGRVRRRTPWLIRLRRADMIVTVSEAVRREIATRFGIAPDRIRAIPNAASGLFRPVTPIAAGGRPYFLFVGTLEPRKNLPALIEAWRLTRHQTGADLLVAGRTRADFVPIPAMEGLTLLGEVADSELPGLFSGALALIYPTHYEGFGLPVLEAMQCGCPVITSRDPAVTEVSGGAALHCGDPREIGDAMLAVAAKPEYRLQLRDRGLARARDFSWPRAARQIRALYTEVLTGKFKRAPESGDCP